MRPANPDRAPIPEIAVTAGEEVQVDLIPPRVVRVRVLVGVGTDPNAHGVDHTVTAGHLRVDGRIHTVVQGGMVVVALVDGRTVLQEDVKKTNLASQTLSFVQWLLR